MKNFKVGDLVTWWLGDLVTWLTTHNITLRALGAHWFSHLWYSHWSLFFCWRFWSGRRCRRPRVHWQGEAGVGRDAASHDINDFFASKNDIWFLWYTTWTYVVYCWSWTTTLHFPPRTKILIDGNWRAETGCNFSFRSASDYMCPEIWKISNKHIFYRKYGRIYGMGRTMVIWAYSCAWWMESWWYSIDYQRKRIWQWTWR